jgi:hypothetical protein
MNQLSDKAIEVLRKIDEQGLHVLWSFKVPRPEYGQTYGEGETMPDDDWQVVESELSKTVHHEERGFYNQRRTIKRDLAFANMRIKGIESMLVHRSDDGVLQHAHSMGQRFESFLPEPVRHYFTAQNEVVLNPGAIEISGLNTNAGDAVRVESEETNIEGEEYFHSYDEWVSEWLEREHVPMDDWFEENQGMIDRYTLTDAAKQLISK